MVSQSHGISCLCLQGFPASKELCYQVTLHTHTHTGPVLHHAQTHHSSTNTPFQPLRLHRQQPHRLRRSATHMDSKHAQRVSGFTAALRNVVNWVTMHLASSRDGRSSAAKVCKSVQRTTSPLPQMHGQKQGSQILLDIAARGDTMKFVTQFQHTGSAHCTQTIKQSAPDNQRLRKVPRLSPWPAHTNRIQDRSPLGSRTDAHWG